MADKKQIVYVLGSAFSGSTIFGFLLGTFRPFVNLGEVINISNDYNPKSICSCGFKLEDCDFYTSAKSRFSEIGFTYKRGRQLFDVRGWNWKKFLLLVGFPFQWIYKRAEIQNYLDWNTSLFFTHTNENHTVIDLSKSSERLDLLKRDPRLEIKVIHLVRPISEIYYSNIKRPKKTRSFLPFKKLREAVFVNLRFASEQRSAKRFNAFIFPYTSISELNYNRWLELLSFLDVRNDENIQQLEKLIESRNVDISKQHVFVGNRWIKSYSGKMVPIEIKNNSNSTKSADLIIRIVTFFFGHSKFLY